MAYTKEQLLQAAEKAEKAGDTNPSGSENGSHRHTGWRYRS